MEFDHISHQLRSTGEVEVWCGGTQPPSLIETDYQARELTIRVYEGSSEVHSLDSSVEPSHREVISVPLSKEMDAYAISRAARMVVRTTLGLQPEISVREEILKINPKYKG